VDSHGTAYVVAEHEATAREFHHAEAGVEAGCLAIELTGWAIVHARAPARGSAPCERADLAL